MSSFTEARRGKLRRGLRRAGLDGLLVSNESNVTYLSGFTGDSSYLLVGRQRDVIISDGRYTEQIEQECSGLDVEIRPQSRTMPEAVAGVARTLRVANLGVEGASLTLESAGKLESQLLKCKLVTTSGLVEQLREIKDREEVAAIRLAVQMAERAFDVIRASLRAEQSERMVAADLEHQIRQFGGVGCSFPPIVAVGARAALPHARPTDQTIGAAGFVLIDWGAQAGLYRSDLTRVLITGNISPKLRDIYRVVLKANLAGIAAVRPGALMSDVDAAARRVIEKSGYGKAFSHSLGHGIGLDIHESPRLAATSNLPLKAGMVVTIEPGIYLPGFGGVRIEDDVLVTRSGHQVLSTVPKDWESCSTAI